MKKPPKNETLEQAAIRRENERHAGRLAEIKAMSARLRLLQPYVAVLKAQGIELYPEEVRAYRSKPLHVMQGFFNSRNVQRAIDTLKAHGFKEVEVRDNANCISTVIILGKGHLQLSFDLDKPRDAAPPPAAALAAPGLASPASEGKPA